MAKKPVLTAPTLGQHNAEILAELRETQQPRRKFPRSHTPSLPNSESADPSVDPRPVLNRCLNGG